MVSVLMGAVGDGVEYRVREKWVDLSEIEEPDMVRG